MKNKLARKGVILMGVLWVVVILSLVAFGLSRRSGLESALMETYQGKVRSYAAARAGLAFVLERLEQSPTLQDTLYSSGIKLEEDQTPEALFSKIKVGDNAHAEVQWPGRGFTDEKVEAWGLQDETGKINVNAITLENFQILSALFELKELSRSKADALARAVARFKIRSSDPGSAELKSMNDDEEEVGRVKAKGRPFDDLFELLGVSGMTREIFDLVKDDLTVYGDAQNGLSVNMHTASDEVIEALAAAAARVNTQISRDSVAGQARGLRDGADGKPFTDDDGSPMDANTADWPPALRPGKSMYLRARVTGVDDLSGVRTVIQAVIRRGDGPGGSIIVGWQRD